MLEAFIEFVKQHDLFQKNRRILAGVSGGIDSVTLCDLLHRAGFSFGIVHCNFGLRGGEADADDIFTQSLAESYDVPFYHTRFETKKYAEDHGISIQMAARELRYRYFEEIREKESYDVTAVGTNLNDDIETALINLTRGTGLKGLTGISPHRDNIVRPLLFASREMIEQYARENSLNWREDSSNTDTKYLRNRIRSEVIPALKKGNPALESTFAENIKNFKQADAFIENRLAPLIKKLTVSKGKVRHIRIPQLLETPDASFVLFRILSPYGFNRSQIEKIMAALKENHPGKQFQSTGYTLTVDRELVIIEPRKKNIKAVTHIPAKEMELSHPAGIKTKIIPIETFELDRSRNIACLDMDKLSFPLTVRTPQDGDRIQPLGMKGQKKLSDLFIDEKIPLNEKKRIPVVLSGDDIAWVGGLKISDKFKITGRTQRVFILKLTDVEQ